MTKKLDVSIKNWYISKYPSDEVGNALSPTVTFHDLNDLLNSGKGDVYFLLGGNADTNVRERCFEKLCELTNQTYNEVYNKWVECGNIKDYTSNFLYKINLKKFRDSFDSCDLTMLDYIKDYITPDLEELYYEVLEYNEIYANGWTIQELFKMGKNDSYWIERAEKFIKKHNVPKKDYNEYTKYFDDYCSLRNKLLEELGLYRYIDDDLTIDKIPKHGFLESDTMTRVKDIKEGNSYTVARVMNFGNCIELHYYPNGTAEIECGYKYSHGYWKSVIKEAPWFNLKMTDKEISEKLYNIFEKEFGLDKLELKKEKEMEMEI